MSEPTGIPRDLDPDLAAAIASGLLGGGRGQADGPDNDPPAGIPRCSFCDYKYECMSPGPSCQQAVRQAGMAPRAPAAEPAPEGVWVTWTTTKPGDKNVIHAFYRDELEALRAAVGKGLKVRMLGWGEGL